MRLRAALVVALLTTVPAVAEGLKPGDEITGKLRFFRQRHPNGHDRINVYQLTSDRPRAFAAKDEFCDAAKPPRTFHLIASGKAEKRQLDRVLGRTVTVIPEDLMCAQTAWHVGDAVVFKWRLIPPRSR